MALPPIYLDAPKLYRAGGNDLMWALSGCSRYAPIMEELVEEKRVREAGPWRSSGCNGVFGERIERTQ